jgi:type VI secretion system protein ImpL
MKNPLYFPRSAVLSTAAITLVLILAVWFAGPYLGMERRTIFLAAGAILAVWILFLVILLVTRKVRSARAARLAENGRSQAQSAPSKPEDAVAVGGRLARTIQWLKQSKLAKAGWNPVYDLPWYLFIGLQGSGKSTLITQSGFSFSYTEPKKAVGKPSVGPTESCDLWVANEAVFIDPSGKYFSGAYPTDAWRDMLGQIKRHRKAKPVDGIVLVVDMDALLPLGHDALREQAERSRVFLDMTAQEFGMVLPIYVMFNNSDRIEGFKEFFCEPGDGDNTPLGATFRREQYQNPHPENEFKLEYDEIRRSLMARRTVGLVDKSRQMQEKIYAFPAQFSMIREQLGEFIEVLFKLNQFRERPLLRGFYFISSVQTGRNRDLVADLMKSKAGLPKTVEVVQPQGARSYFINPLFTRVIIPDRNLAGLSSAVRRRRLRLRMAALGLAGVVLPIILLAFAWGAYRDNSGLLSAVELSRGIAARDGKNTDNLSALVDMKRRLENLECRGQTSACRIRGRRFHWGLFAGDPALNQARSVYLEKLKLLFMDPLFTSDTSLGHKYNGLKTQLNMIASAATRGPTAKPAQMEFNPVQAYTLLKTFLMFSTEAKADASFLQEQTRDYWCQGVQEKDTPLAVELLTFYLHQLGDHRNPAYRISRNLADDEVIDRIRKLLLVVEPDRYYYGILQEEGKHKINSITLAGILQGKGVQIFDSGTEVDGTYTKIGWDTFARDKIEAMKRDYEEERSWVLGTPALGPSETRIDEKLRTYYFRDYEAYWWSFLKSIGMRRFDGFQDASQKLTILTDAQQSPLSLLLKAASVNTWEDLNATKLKESQDAPGALDRVPGGQVEAVAQNFQAIHSFVRQKENQESPLAQYIKALSRLQVVIRSFLDANQPAAEIGKIGQEADAALQVTNGLLVSFDANSRQVVEPLLKQPIQQVLTILNKSTPVGAVKDDRQRSLITGGILKDKNKTLDGATIILLEAYADSRFQANKEIMRTQTRNGDFRFPNPINPGQFKICAIKKGDNSYYCGDVRLGKENEGKTYELREPRSLVVFGGGKLDLTLRFR